MKASGGIHAAWANLFRGRPEWADEVTALWAQTPLFEGVPHRLVRRLAASSHPREYATGEALFRVGEIGAGAVLIVSGEVAIGDPSTGVVTLKAGDFFGESALVDEVPRRVDARATAPVRAAYLLRQHLSEWMGEAPKAGLTFALNLARVLATRLDARMSDPAGTAE